MNLQLPPAGVPNPVLPASARSSVAPGQEAQDAAENGAASPAIDFALLLAQSLAPGVEPAPGAAVPATPCGKDAAKESDSLPADDAATGIAVFAPLPAALELPAAKSAPGAPDTAQATQAGFAAAGERAVRRPAAPPDTGLSTLPSASTSDSPALAALPGKSPGSPMPSALPVSSPAATKGLFELAAAASSSGGENIASPLDRTASLAPTPAHAASPALPRMEIATPLTGTGWDAQLGQRVLWMSSQKLQVAQLHVNPPELGPVEMRLTLDTNGQQASLQFSSPHAEVRDTIAGALPRLREMMADAGIALGNATVSGESLPQHHATPDQGRPAAQAFAGTLTNAPVASESPRSQPRAGNGLVDTFA